MLCASTRLCYDDLMSRYHNLPDPRKLKISHADNAVSSEEAVIVEPTRCCSV